MEKKQNGFGVGEDGDPDPDSRWGEIDRAQDLAELVDGDHDLIAQLVEEGVIEARDDDRALVDVDSVLAARTSPIASARTVLSSARRSSGPWTSTARCSVHSAARYRCA